MFYPQGRVVSAGSLIGSGCALFLRYRSKGRRRALLDGDWSTGLEVSSQERREGGLNIFPNKKGGQQMDSIIHVGEMLNLVLALAAHTMMICHFRRK